MSSDGAYALFGTTDLPEIPEVGFEQVSFLFFFFLFVQCSAKSISLEGQELIALHVRSNVWGFSESNNNCRAYLSNNLVIRTF